MTIITILAVCQVGLTANILVMLPTAVPSHLNTFKFLIKALAVEHNITFYGMPLKLNNNNVTEKEIKFNMDSYLGDLR